MVSSLCGELGLLLTAAMLSVGCGTMMLSHDEGAALQAAASPAAVPEFLGLLPAKKGEPRDPGEITDKRDFHGFVRFDLYVIYPAVGAGCRLGVDRAHPIGIEFHGGFVGVSDSEDSFGVTVAGASALFVLGASGAFLGARVNCLWEPEGTFTLVGVDVITPFAGRWEMGFGLLFTVPPVKVGPPPVLPWVGVGVRF